MATYANLRITGVNGVPNSGLEEHRDTRLLVNESTEFGTVIGKIEGFHPEEDLSKLEFTASGVYGDAEGRYEIVRATAAMAAAGTGFAEGDWVIVLRDNGVAYDYETSPDALDRITFTVSTIDDSPLKSEYGLAFDFEIVDVNEAPDHVTVGGHAAPTVDEGLDGRVVGLLEALDEDDINNDPDARREYNYAIVAGERHSDMFEITADNQLKLIDGLSLSWEDAPEKNDDGSVRWYEVVILVSDDGGYNAEGNADPTGKPAATRKVTVKVFVTQDVVPTDIQIDGGVEKTVRENSTDLGTMTAVDGTGIKAFVVHEDFDDLFRVDLVGGKFTLRWIGADPLNFENDEHKTFTIRVKAIDNNDNESDWQEITINVEDINEAPDVTLVGDDEITIGTDAENDDLIAAFTASDLDAGLWGQLVFTLSGAPDELLAALEIEDDGAGGKRIIIKDASVLANYAGQTFTITLTATDMDGDAADGLSDSFEFDLTIEDAAETLPADILLSDNAVWEFPDSVNTFIGDLSNDDADAALGEYVYKIVLTDPLTGEILKDAFGADIVVDSDGRFRINGLQLETDTQLGLDFEIRSDYTIKIRMMKAGATDPDDWHLDKDITISLLDMHGELVFGGGDGELILADFGNDVLDGGGGSDTLRGGVGRDELTGGDGNDYFLFDVRLSFGDRDTIMDFVSGEDKIQLVGSEFGLGTLKGELNATRFVNGKVATENTHRIVYDGSTGKLLFDPTGARVPDDTIEICSFDRFMRPTELKFSDFDII